ncbi:MAG: Gfo/Idh/MocA family oxidoreductase [Marmoricola sp.]
MANLRAGLIGLGMMGRHHARVLGSLGGVDLVAVADPGGDPHHVAGDRPLHASIEDLIAENLDYCMVAVPTIYHEEIALALAAAGVHAMIEKPLAQDTASAQRIADAFAAAGLVGAVGHIERYNPALQSARKRLENGDLGKVYQVVTRRQGPFPARIADVGVVKDLATHDIDLTAWVTQQPYVTVSARTAHQAGREYEDMVSAVGHLADGTITSHLVNWLSPFKERLTVITGEKGAFVASTLTADLTFHANGSIDQSESQSAQFRGVTEGDVIKYELKRPEPLMTEHEQFRDAVLGKEADIVTLEQGLRTVQVAEAMIQAAKDGTVITLPH